MEHLDAVHSGQNQIEDHHVGFLLDDGLDSGFSVEKGANHFKPACNLNEFSEHVTNGTLILDNDDALHTTPISTRKSRSGILRSR